MRSSSRVLILLLALIVGLAALLAYEAQRATRSHRVTADRALRDYASVAAWEFLTATDELLGRGVGEALGPVIAPAASPYDSLPPPAALAGTANHLLRCDSGPDTARRYFALDLRGGVLTTSGAPLPAVTERWLRDTLVLELRAGGGARGHGTIWGRGPGEGRVAVYGLKSLRYSGYPRHDAPLAAYGVLTCPAAFAPLFTRVIETHLLLPRAVTGGLANAELVSLRVLDPAGRPIFTAGPGGPPAYQGDPATAGAGALSVRAALPPEAAGRLAVAQPRSRLPLLLGLLGLTAGLGLVTLRQVRREQELVRLRADFTSSVSHELRTPLTQILLFAETLELGRARGEAERRQALDIIVQEARRLAHLVDNVLQFSRAERRVLRVRPEPHRLAPLVREIVERFAPLAGSAALRIRTELDEALVARVHPESLHQVLVNLLDNAVKHGGPGGTIALRTRERDGWARIEVEDQGPGIPSEERERVFQPFVRLARPGPAGSGLGLVVVRELVQAQEGRCLVEDGVGGGTRFVVELPGAARGEPAGRTVEPTMAGAR